jgi:hypothetical protein
LNKALLSAIAVLVALAALVAGCGGGDETTDSATLTKTQFIKQGDAICKEANAENETEAEEFAEENGFTLEEATDEQLEETVSVVLVPSLNQQVEDLKALGAPEGDEEKVEAILVAVEDAADDIEEDPGSVFKEKTLEEPNRLADAYGLKVCGQE